MCHYKQAPSPTLTPDTRPPARSPGAAVHPHGGDAETLPAAAAAAGRPGAVNVLFRPPPPTPQYRTAGWQEKTAARPPRQRWRKSAPKMLASTAHTGHEQQAAAQLGCDVRTGGRPGRSCRSPPKAQACTTLAQAPARTPPEATLSARRWRTGAQRVAGRRRPTANPPPPHQCDRPQGCVRRPRRSRVARTEACRGLFSPGGPRGRIRRVQPQRHVRSDGPLTATKTAPPSSRACHSNGRPPARLLGRCRRSAARKRCQRAARSLLTSPAALLSAFLAVPPRHSVGEARINS